MPAGAGNKSVGAEPGDKSLDVILPHVLEGGILGCDHAVTGVQ